LLVNHQHELDHWYTFFLSFFDNAWSLKITVNFPPPCSECSESRRRRRVSSRRIGCVYFNMNKFRTVRPKVSL
jgi:hypothetical protein